MESSKFKFNVSSLRPVETGVKTACEVKPTFEVSQTPGHFKLNSVAASLLKVVHGDSIVFFPNPDAESLSEQYLLAKAPVDVEGKPIVSSCKLANSTKSKGYVILNGTSVSIWSILLQQELGASAIGKEPLLDKGLIKESGKNYIATNRIIYDIENAGLGNDIMIDGVVFETLFVLTNPKIKDVIVRTYSEKEEDNDYATRGESEDSDY